MCCSFARSQRPQHRHHNQNKKNQRRPAMPRPHPPAHTLTRAQPARRNPPARPPEPATAGPPAPPAPKPTPVETTIEQPKLYKATFTSEGAAPKSWVLLDPQYKEDNPKASNKE